MILGAITKEGSTMPSQSRKVSFQGSQGGLLDARLELPLGEPRACALFAHCFTCSKETRAATYITAALAEQGIAVLRFDFTGLGGSEGDFANTNFTSNVDDLIYAADFLRREFQPPRILVGHSLGGAAVLAAAGRIAEARAVVTIGAPADPAHVLHMLSESRQTIADVGEAEVKLGGRSFRIRQQFIDDLGKYESREAIAHLRKALLVFHAPLDATVSVDNAAQIFMAAKHPKSFVSLDNADHLLSRKEDALYCGHVLAAWAARYIDDVAAAPVTAPSPAPGKVLVQETREGKFTEMIRAGNHTLRADEPVAAGGLDTGLSPYDLLLAALGACTAMTLRLYADLKQFPLERVSVELEHAKIHAQDCADCETREGKIDRIVRVIRLEGTLDAAQRAKLLEIANKCPVHRTLHSEVQVQTALAQ